MAETLKEIDNRLEFVKFTGESKEYRDLYYKQIKDKSSEEYFEIIENDLIKGITKIYPETQHNNSMIQTMKKIIQDIERKDKNFKNISKEDFLSEITKEELDELDKSEIKELEDYFNNDKYFEEAIILAKLLELVMRMKFLINENDEYFSPIDKKELSNLNSISNLIDFIIEKENKQKSTIHEVFGIASRTKHRWKKNGEKISLASILKTKPSMLKHGVNEKKANTYCYLLYCLKIQEKASKEIQQKYPNMQEVLTMAFFVYAEEIIPKLSEWLWKEEN